MDTNYKPNLLFDAITLTSFSKKSKHRTGIFFVAYNILNELKHRQIFNITLHIKNHHYKYFRSMRNDSFFSEFNFVISFDTKQYLSNINVHKRNIKTEKSLFKIFTRLLKIIKNYLSILGIIKYWIFERHKTIKVLKNTDIFLSLFSPPPDEIKIHNKINKFIFLHDVIPLLFPEYYPYFFTTNNYINEFAEKRYVKKENYYFYNSESTRNDYLKFYENLLDKNKLFVTHIAPSQAFHQEYDKIKLNRVLNKYGIHYEENKKYIFSLCSLEPRKNLLFTISCFINFIKKHSIENLYFYLGGPNWDLFIHEFEKCKKVIHLGYVDDEDINILYSNSLFFTYISQYEGFGMPPLEAMQAGTPVITSNNSSLPEVVGDAAIMIDYNNEEQCIKAFEDLYFNDSQREYYIKKGLERAKVFSWKKTVDTIAEKMLESLKT